MRNTRKKLSLGLLAATAVIVSACGGGSGGSSGGGEAVKNEIDTADASIVSKAFKMSGGIVRKSGNVFTFPEISNENGEVVMTIPAGPLPAFPARRTVFEGSGETIEFGDPVTLKYDMFSWANGTLVESSNVFSEAVTVTAGVTTAFPIPEYLGKSLLGRSIGDTLQVVLPVGTEDIPEELDLTDAHVVLVELL